MKKRLSVFAITIVLMASSCEKNNMGGTPLQKLAGTWTYQYCVPTYDETDTIYPSGFGLQQLVFGSCSDFSIRCDAHQVTTENISIQWQYSLDPNGHTFYRYNNDSSITEYQLIKLETNQLIYVDTIQQYSYYLTK